MNRGIFRRGAFLVAVMAAAVALPVSLATAGGGVSPNAKPAKKKNGKKKGAVFPVRGKHSYGDGLGAGRGHQGQDVMARCGTKLVAARKGRVRHKDYQGSGAGHYIVVREKTKKGRFDYVYMHLKRKAKVRVGQRLRPGQKIGLVGSTGRSSACHLHFEMWKGPGWYRGSKVVNPRPHLKRWDRRS